MRDNPLVNEVLAAQGKARSARRRLKRSSNRILKHCRGFAVRKAERQLATAQARLNWERLFDPETAAAASYWYL